MAKKTTKKRVTKGDLEQMLRQVVEDHEDGGDINDNTIDDIREMLAMSTMFGCVTLNVHLQGCLLPRNLEVDDPDIYNVSIDIPGGHVDNIETEVYNY